MPVIKLYHHGITAGMPPGKITHERALRGEVYGWSHQATRNNTSFLRSVRLEKLSGLGFAFTLTVKDCPSTSDEWHKLRSSFIKRLRRMGMVRGHWVTEWQRRGVPHLHGVAYFNLSTHDADFSSQYIVIYSGIKDAWLEVSAKFGSQRWGQNLKPITDALGWLQYLAKHASRGVSHYQRSSENIPAGWKKTGRVWGKVGDWPTDEPIRLELSRRGYFHFRRLVRSWRKSQASTSGDKFRIVTARKMLQDSDKHRCEVRGVSEWIPESLALHMLHFLASQGFTITN